jgi:hypothetical protein
VLLPQGAGRNRDLPASAISVDQQIVQIVTGEVIAIPDDVDQSFTGHDRSIAGGDGIHEDVAVGVHVVRDCIVEHGARCLAELDLRNHTTPCDVARVLRSDVRLARPPGPTIPRTWVTGSSISFLNDASRSPSDAIVLRSPIANCPGCVPAETSRNLATLMLNVLPPVLVSPGGEYTRHCFRARREGSSGNDQPRVTAINDAYDDGSMRASMRRGRSQPCANSAAASPAVVTTVEARPIADAACA